MAAFFCQIQRTIFSGFCRARPSYLRLLRPLTVQNFQRKAIATLDLKKKANSTGETIETRGEDHLDAPRVPSAVARRLHVGNILTGKENYTTEDTLFKYFSQYGEIENLEFFRRKFSNLPRGFAFVTFRHVKSAQKVLADAESHVIDGQNVTISLPLKTGNKVVQGKADLTVLVNNILKNTSKQDIEEHFSQFGKVERVILAQKDPTDENLSRYYVMFSSLSGAKKSLEHPLQKIAGQNMDSQVSEFNNTKNFTGKTKRVYVKLLPDHITVENLRDYFKKFGDVERVEIKIDYCDLPYPVSNSNIAFVHFLDEGIVEEIVKNEDHIINGSGVKVLKHRNLFQGREHLRWRFSLEGLPLSTRELDVNKLFLATFGLVPMNIVLKRPRAFRKKVVCVVGFSKPKEFEMVLRKPSVVFSGAPVYFHPLFWGK